MVIDAQVMDCCVTDESCGLSASKPVEANCTANELHDTGQCSSCNGQGRPVSRKTVLVMLKPGLLERAMQGNYNFCPERDCSIVYFEDRGSQQFTVNDLRVRVGLKVKGDPIPVCYCFGFDEKHIRDEIEQTGNTSVPEKVSRLIREGLCACEACSPSGMCCLGELNKTVNRLTETSQSR